MVRLRGAVVGDVAHAVPVRVIDRIIRATVTQVTHPVVIAVFLRNIRMTIIAALAIPTSVVGTFAFTWMISYGTFGLIAPETFGTFFDYQMAGLLSGRLDVPGEAIAWRRGPGFGD